MWELPHTLFPTLSSHWRFSITTLQTLYLLSGACCGLKATLQTSPPPIDQDMLLKCSCHFHFRSFLSSDPCGTRNVSAFTVQFPSTCFPCQQSNDPFYGNWWINAEDFSKCLVERTSESLFYRRDYCSLAPHLTPGIHLSSHFSPLHLCLFITVALTAVGVWTHRLSAKGFLNERQQYVLMSLSLRVRVYASHQSSGLNFLPGLYLLPVFFTHRNSHSSRHHI